MSIREIRKVVDNEDYKVASDGTMFNKDGSIKKLGIDNKGYLKANLYKDGKESTKQVHRLVAKTFIPNPLNKPCINHKNGIKSDNRVENLEWCDYSENVRHALDTGLLVPLSGDQHPRPMLGRRNPNAAFKNRVKVMIVETGETFDSVAECARYIDGNSRHITDCLHGRRNVHKGLHFEAI